MILPSCSSGRKKYEFKTDYAKFKVSYKTHEGYRIYRPDADLSQEEIEERINIRKKNSLSARDHGDIEVTNNDGEAVLFVQWMNQKDFVFYSERARAIEDKPGLGGVKVTVLDDYLKDDNRYFIYIWNENNGKRIQYTCLIDLGESRNLAVELYSLTSEDELRKFTDVFSFTDIADYDVELDDPYGIPGIVSNLM
jgi:hypothetical protein